MDAARAELVSALDGGGRNLAPRSAAVAQTSFDCWVSQAEGSWNSTRPCKDQFSQAMTMLKSAVAGGMPSDVPVAPAAAPGSPVPVADASKGEVVPVQQAAFMVFFDWDRHDLTQSAQDVLEALTGELKARKDVKQVVVVGHADTSGPEKYNMKLSMKRADAVRGAIISRGYPPQQIRTEARGETDLLIKTPDNVRQPENRRAQITLE